MSLVVSQHPNGSGAALYLSGIREIERACAEERITHVVSACKHGIAARYAAAVAAETLNCSMDDYGRTPIEPLLKLTSCIEWIANALQRGGRVLVHCSMGINRSPALLIAFLVHSGVSLREAGVLLHHTRPQTDPLDAYWLQLEELEMRQRATCCSTLSRRDIPSAMSLLQHAETDSEIDAQMEALERRWADATASVGGVDHVILGVREKLAVYWSAEVGVNGLVSQSILDLGVQKSGSGSLGDDSDDCDEVSCENDVWGSIPVDGDTLPVPIVRSPHDSGHNVTLASADSECCTKCRVS